MKSIRVLTTLARLVTNLFVLGCVAHITSAQTRPPTLVSVTPYGIQRGKTATFTIEGRNLTDASRIQFDDSGIKARIVKVTDLGPDKIQRAAFSTTAPIEDLARRNQITAEITVDPATPTGRHTLRVKTPLGASNIGVFFVGAVPEVAEIEPNDTSPQNLDLPMTVNGALGMASDNDYYRFVAKAGQQIVFEVIASSIRSSLDSTLTLMDEKERVLASNEDFNGRADSVLAHTFAETGPYVVRVSDALNGGGRGHFYRLTIGELPYITNVFPLGAANGSSVEIEVDGFNLGESRKVKLAGPPSGGWGATVPVSLNAVQSEPLNKARVAVGDHPEIMEKEANDAPTSAQVISFPVTINGRIYKEGAVDRDTYGFKAKRGQRIVFTVAAQRLGSPLDSVIEVLDSRGREIPRATLRPVWQTFITLRDHDSLGQGIRLDTWNGINVGDYVLIGSELLQVVELPKHPDADVVFRGYRGRRTAFEDTTPEGHALNSSVYKVEVHKPGAAFPSNGMPVFNLTYRNDDGGPVYGRDSNLTFTAPADGDYVVRISDVRGQSGKSYSYRLTIAEPEPSFTLAVSPSSPNVPLGGRVPVTISANRLSGFDGVIDVRVKDLPPGIQGTPGTILPGQNAVTITISASDSVNLPEPVPLNVVGQARINGREVVRKAEPDESISVISVTSPPDLYVTAVDPQVVEVEPGGRVKVTVKIKRSNGFTGRVPISVQNLPSLLTVPDIGLNGILITEEEEMRDFYVVADPRAEPLEQVIIVSGRVEVNSPLPSDHSSVPIKLKVVPKRGVASR